MRQGSQHDLESDLALFSAVEKRSGWLRGLLVARRVQPENAGPSAPSTTASGTFVRISAVEFARRVGTTRERVLALWNAWERAADDGVVPHALDLAPDTDVAIPDEEKVPWFGEGGYYRSYEARMPDPQRRKALEEESERAGIKPTDPIYMAHRPGAMRVAILADPKVRQAAAEALQEVDRREHEAAAAVVVESAPVDSESTKAREYIRAAQERMGGNPMADLDRADEERALTDRLLLLKLELDAVLRSMQEVQGPLSSHSMHLLQATCAHITTATDWISTLAKSGREVDDQALEAFLASEGGAK